MNLVRGGTLVLLGLLCTAGRSNAWPGGERGGQPAISVSEKASDVDVISAVGRWAHRKISSLWRLWDCGDLPSKAGAALDPNGQDLTLGSPEDGGEGELPQPADSR